MPTNEERREIAAKLRGLYPNDILPPFAQVRKDIYEAIGCGWGQEHQGQKLHKRLADLIEPEPERTGRNTYEGRELECSECGTQWHLLVREDVVTEWAHVRTPNYCPNCGAKVVSE